MFDKTLEEAEAEQKNKEFAMRYYIKYVIDELDPADVRKVFTFISAVVANRKSPSTYHSTWGNKKYTI